LLALACLALAAQGAWGVIRFASPVLSRDRSGDFVAGYFSGAAKAMFLAELAVCLIFAPLAWRFGRAASKRLRRSPMRPPDDSRRPR